MEYLLLKVSPVIPAVKTNDLNPFLPNITFKSHFNNIYSKINYNFKTFLNLNHLKIKLYF